MIWNSLTNFDRLSIQTESACNMNMQNVFMFCRKYIKQVILECNHLPIATQAPNEIFTLPHGNLVFKIQSKFLIHSSCCSAI